MNGEKKKPGVFLSFNITLTEIVDGRTILAFFYKSKHQNGNKKKIRTKVVETFLADWNLSNTKIDFTSGFNRILHEIRRMDKFFQPYDKECMKMALLKHEETFKEQVYELHRLYQVQKMLMKNLQVSKHNHQENICFNNYPQKNKIDLEQPATTKDQYDHVTKTSNNDQETEEDECEIELTLAPTSFNRKRRMTNKPGSLDSVPSFSSSSTGSSFLSSNRRNSSSSDISLKQSPWMYQVLSLNMST